MKSILVLSLLALISASVAASDQRGAYLVRGIGAHSCGKFIQARRQNTYYFYGNWITGFVTSVNIYTSNTYDIAGSTDVESVLLWMEKYCEKNPFNDITDAAQAAVIQLMPNRTRMAPKR